MNRRITTLVVALVPVLVFLVLAAIVRVPYVSLAPGPTFNTLGEVEGEQVVEIDGTDTYPTAGNLNMTTVSQQDGLTLGQALAYWIGGRSQLIPRDLIYPPEKSREEIDADNSQQFQNSEDDAEFAALGYLDYPAAVTILGVNDPGASAGKLEEGDAIDAVDGKPVATLDELRTVLEATRPGQDVVVDYRRKNQPAGTVTITLGSAQDRPSGVLGVEVTEAPWAPFVVDFHLANIGGPSAGLMFSLAVVDKLTDGELNGGDFVAGTGTITASGEVGPIGGITHKIVAAEEAGATVFLVPADNCDEARSADDGGMELVRVETLTGAVDALNTISAGGEPPTC